jgi:hypothetical protein
MREILIQVRKDICVVGRTTFRALVEDERVKVPLQLYTIIVVRQRIEFVRGFVEYAFKHTKTLARGLHWEEADANVAISSFMRMLKDAFPRVCWTNVPLAGYRNGKIAAGDFGARVEKGTLHVHQEILDACSRIPWGRVKDAEAFLTFVQSHRAILAWELGWPVHSTEAPISELTELLQWAFPKIPWTPFVRSAPAKVEQVTASDVEQVVAPDVEQGIEPDVEQESEST